MKKEKKKMKYLEETKEWIELKLGGKGAFSQIDICPRDQG